MEKENLRVQRGEKRRLAGHAKTAKNNSKRSKTIKNKPQEANIGVVVGWGCVRDGRT